jgi:hypothetical protein
MNSNLVFTHAVYFTDGQDVKETERLFLHTSEAAAEAHKRKLNGEKRDESHDWWVKELDSFTSERMVLSGTDKRVWFLVPLMPAIEQPNPLSMKLDFAYLLDGEPQRAPELMRDILRRSIRSRRANGNGQGLFDDDHFLGLEPDPKNEDDDDVDDDDDLEQLMPTFRLVKAKVIDCNGHGALEVAAYRGPNAMRVNFEMMSHKSSKDQVINQALTETRFEVRLQTVRELASNLAPAPAPAPLEVAIADLKRKYDQQFEDLRRSMETEIEALRSSLLPAPKKQRTLILEDDDDDFI